MNLNLSLELLKKRICDIPINVFWRGFASNTSRLKQYGWTFDSIVYEDYLTSSISVCVNINNIGEGIEDLVWEGAFPRVETFDYWANALSGSTIDISEIEKTKQIYKQEIIVDPTEVKDLLAEILDKQKPKQKEIRGRILQENLKTTCDARILSFAS